MKARAHPSQDHTLEKMARIACGSGINMEDWIPSKIHLSVPLMWDILQFNCSFEAQPRTDGLLHPSLAPTVAPDEVEETSTLEIIVATSPEVTVNTADGGQTAPVSTFKAPIPSSAPEEPQNAASDIWVAPIDNLMINTPWLWADPSQFVDIGDIPYNDLGPPIGVFNGS